MEINDDFVHSSDPGKVADLGLQCSGERTWSFGGVSENKRMYIGSVYPSEHILFFFSICS